jgi:hypothetical protein
MKQLENIAVKVDSKEQWEQVAAVLEGYGYKKCVYRIFNDWDYRLQIGRKSKYALTLHDGINLWGNDAAIAKTIYTFTDFMQKFSNPQPDPIAELTKRLEALEARVFGNTEQAQPETEPKPETVYDGVFWFEIGGVSCCCNGKKVLLYDDISETWDAVSLANSYPTPHRLVPVDKFTVGKWYASGDGDYTTQYEYLMYLGNDKFVGWSGHPNQPIIICNQEDGEVQLLEVQPA